MNTPQCIPKWLDKKCMLIFNPNISGLNFDLPIRHKSRTLGSTIISCKPTRSNPPICFIQMALSDILLFPRLLPFQNQFSMRLSNRWSFWKASTISFICPRSVCFLTSSSSYAILQFCTFSASLARAISYR